MSSINATPTAKGPSDPKPIKLRSACNSCFSAKVRCDGNKEGCSRCVEKRLECTFSESRVGKVVGKRRKRPLPSSITTTALLELLPVNQTSGGLLSPASTHASEGSSKRSCPDSSWTSLLAYDDQSALDLFDCEEQSPSFDMLNTTNFVMETDMFFQASSGLPTPSLSPPDNRFLSPAELETQSDSRHSNSSGPVHNFVQPTVPASASKTPEPHNDDEETVCIKLLAHLKKHISPSPTTIEAQLNLVNKTNATVRRLLRSKNVRCDYTCQLLLSSIATHLTTLTEKMCKQKFQQSADHPETEFLHERYISETSEGAYFDQNRQSGKVTSQREAVLLAVKETMNLCSGVGDLLKQKPLNGFQTLGRHESLHIELDHRLKKALALLT